MVKFNDKFCTFKALTFTILNGNHINKKNALIKEFIDKKTPTFEANNDIVTNLLIKLWQVSVNATFILAINTTISEPILIYRYDNIELNDAYKNEKSASHCDFLIKMDHNVLFYDNRKKLFVYRSSDQKDQRIYYADDIYSVFNVKTRTSLLNKSLNKQTQS